MDSNDSKNDNSDKIEEFKDKFNGWNKDKEKMLVSYSDKARTFELLHNMEYDRLWIIKFFLVVPIIFVGTLTGGGNLSISIFPTEYVTYVNLAFGLANLFSSFVSSIMYYFEIPKTLENHRISRDEWGQFSRDVRDVMNKRPKERKIASEQLKLFSDRYSDFVKKSPLIAQKTIIAYNKKFFNENIIKPEICGVFTPASEYANLSYYDESNDNDDINIMKNINVTIE